MRPLALLGAVLCDTVGIQDVTFESSPSHLYNCTAGIYTRTQHHFENCTSQFGQLYHYILTLPPVSLYIAARIWIIASMQLHITLQTLQHRTPTCTLHCCIRSITSAQLFNTTWGVGQYVTNYSARTCETDLSKQN